MILYSIDPGLRACGVARWEVSNNAPRLTWAGYVKSNCESDNIVEASCRMAQRVLLHCTQNTPEDHLELAIEKPKIYARFSGSPARPEDILNLGIAVGAIACAFPPSTKIFEYLPQDHKGQAPKEVTEARCREMLYASELARVDLPKARGGKRIAISLAHNVWDSCWIGIAHLKQTKRWSADDRMRCMQAGRI